MARPRTEHVRESLQELNRLEARHRGTALEARIRVVRLMKERPVETIATIAEAAGCSERSAHRWWQEYRRDGMASLLGAKKGGLRGTADADRLVDELAAKLRADELTTLKEIQEWLESEHHIRYTLKGVSNLLRDQLRVRRRWIFEDEEKNIMAREAALSAPRSGPRLPEDVSRFLNDLPTANEPVAWVIQFRDALKKFLGDVDHIVMAIAAANGIDRGMTDRKHISVTRNINLGPADSSEHLTSNRDALRPSEAHLENGIRAGFPIDKYHAPHLFDYYVGSVHVGSIILLRERSSKPISAETLALVEELRPFLTFACGDCIARQKDGIPPDQYFTNVLSNEANLTVREREVLTLRLFGAKYTQIAEQLFISVDTVRKHIKSIHAKTHTRTLSDLFARYFRPINNQ